MGTYQQDGKIRTTGFPAGKEYKEYEGMNYYSPVHTTAKAEGGMSGGPVLNDKNEVVGVVSAMVIGGGEVKSVFSRLEDAFARFDHK